MTTNEINLGRSVNARGEALRRLRIQLGMTQEELAAEVGYSDRLIRRAESGDRIDHRTLRVLFKYFISQGLTVNYTEISFLGSESNHLSESMVLTDLSQAVARWFSPELHQALKKNLVEIVDEQIVFCLGGFSGSGIAALHERLQAMVNRYKKIHFIILNVSMSEDWSMTRWQSQREPRASKRCGSIPALDLVNGMTSFRIQQDRIIELWEFSDSDRPV